MTDYFSVSNIFECGKKNSYVPYEIFYMATEDNEYFTDFLDTLNKYQDNHGQRLCSKKLKEGVLHVTEQQKEEIEGNINNITCDTSFQSPVTNSVQKKDASWSLERRLAVGVLAKILKI